jgi:non-specific serine/threonine protein kinase
VTLTGTGGCGKTQLALVVATGLLDSFRDGVWLVDLVPVQTAHLVPQTAIAAIGLSEQSGETPLRTLVGRIGGRRLLLLLDNCEHVIDACAQLAEALLDACPNLRLLTTSREPLRIAGESVWRVPSLGIPEPRSELAPDRVAQFPAPQLFVQRAQAVKSDFAMTSRNAAVVSAICARLEGLPLAIELAAAWVRALSVEQILERLDDTFDLLVGGGSRSAPGRQHTMRAAIDWSYGLLTEAERVVFQRLAVFVGGWSLEAAENVCSDQTVDRREVLARLTRLVDASLVQMEDREQHARYRLLEPVRQYAQMRLSAASDLDAARRQHAAYYLSFAEQWETDANFGGPGRQTALTALERELDNLRAALQWCLETGEAEKGIFLARALWTFWVIRGLYAEGRSWLAQLAALPDAEEAPALRAVAQSIEATLAFRQGDYAVARTLLLQVVPLLPQARVHAPRLVHSVPTDLGNIEQKLGDYSSAGAYFEDALAAVRAAGLRMDEALSLQNLAVQALTEGDYSTAHARGEESLALAREVGDEWAECLSLSALSRIEMLLGNRSAAWRRVEETSTLARKIGERSLLADSLQILGQLAVADGKYPEARAALRECLVARQDMGSRPRIAHLLEEIAALAAAEMDVERAIQLLGAATRIREAIGERLSPMRQAVVDQRLSPLQQALGPEATRSAWEAGRAMPPERALELALAATQTRSTQPGQPAPRQLVAELSPREQQVAALLAEGLTNRQIAERLVVTQRTVASHIEHILEKLGFASRHQVGVWVAEHGLQAEKAD